MYWGAIRHGAHKCLASEKQEALLRLWKGVTLYREKCKVREGENRERGARTEEAGEDTLSLSTVKETEEAKLSCSTPTMCVRVCACARVCVFESVCF